MLADAITSADVYKQVTEMRQELTIMQWTAGVLALFIALQIIAKFAIFSKVLSLLGRVEQLLSLNEKQSELANKRRVETTAAVQAVVPAVRRTVEGVKETVNVKAEEVKATVHEAIKKEDGSQSGIHRRPVDDNYSP